jgi:hypothetical protein
LALAACGSNGQSDKSSAATPAGWADGLCVALTKWKSSIQSVGSTTNVEKLSKSDLEQSATMVSDATEELSLAVKALGKPPRTAAPEAKAAVTELSTQLKTAAGEIESAARDASSAKDLVEATAVAGAALQTMSASISSTVAKLEGLNATDEWKQAFSDSSACQSLRSS